MPTTRRQILRASALAAAGPAAGAAPKADLGRIMNSPVLKTELFKEPVKIASLELLRAGRHYFVRATGANGLVGYSDAHASVMSAAWPILLKRVMPSFLGQDARQLEKVFHEAYLAQSNYKWQGLPFWVSMAAVEIALLDLLGKTAGKPIGELLGSVVRRDIAVYRASGNRGNSPEAEIAYLQKIVAETGARAIKFRLGARMRYDAAPDAIDPVNRIAAYASRSILVGRSNRHILSVQPHQSNLPRFEIFDEEFIALQGWSLRDFISRGRLALQL